MARPSDEAALSPYSTLPLQGPYEVAIGRALITMIEPKIGQDREYNRWYEDEHFYSGATAMPWLFAGRRWVAPVDLQGLRYPEDSVIARPLSAGKYISVYWITEGRYEDHFCWTLATHQRSLPEGRVFLGWASVFTSFQTYAGVVYRDDHGPRDIHALDYPYQGLVVEVIDPTGSRAELEHWLRDDYLPERIAGSPVAMTLLFEPDSPAGTGQPKNVRSVAEREPFEPEGVPGLERLVTLLSFTDVAPPECWSHFAGTGAAIAERGRGRVVLAAPFYPTLPGTDVYVDQLR